MTTLVRTPIAIVKVGDRELSPEEVRTVLEVSITMHEKKADTGQIVFSDNDHRIFDSRLYSKGTQLTFIMGWTDALEPRGPYIVKSYKKTYPESSDSKFTVKFQDKSHKMNREQRQRRFANLSAAQIIRRIAKEHDLGYDIEEPTAQRFTDDFPLLQANQTDAALMQRLAQRYGFVWGIEGSTLYFRPPGDLEKMGQQSQVPVLSWRINDWSLKSFDPEVKFHSGRRRRGAAQRASNVDLMNGTEDDNGIFTIETARDGLEAVSPELGSLVTTLAGQEADDDEDAGAGSRQSSSDSQEDSSDQRVERRAPRRLVDDIRGELGRLVEGPQKNVDEDKIAESEPGDESGLATPDNAEEAETQAAGRVARASEIVEATAIPTIANMKWRPSQAVIFAGLGDRLSGRYRVTEVTQRVSSDSFKTSLKVKRREFRPSSESRRQISEATDTAASDTVGSSEGQPAPTTAEEEVRYVVDDVRGRILRPTRIGGQED